MARFANALIGMLRMQTYGLSAEPPGALPQAEICRLDRHTDRDAGATVSLIHRLAPTTL